ncbi:HNH endonuclease family protein [uncultured Bartonella sp.]|uniref:HNH endonuclease family protein n=1 Tax=uncultured Bartonella sp. TaxID=104108 RepID=UPI0025F0F475|nr:HNH endonuclease family protein [uncultured Bartonella sp.]
MTLLLLALAKTVGTREPYDGFSARKIYNYYLVNEYEEGDRHNRLLLTETDRDTLLAFVNDMPLPVHGLDRILENYNYLIGKLARLNAEELQFLCRGIAKLFIVIVAMTHSNPFPKEWQKTLGPDWQRIQETWLHTAGNLTLTGYNCEYSNRSFEEKRDMHGGFSESPLHLNRGLGELS